MYTSENIKKQVYALHGGIYSAYADKWGNYLEASTLDEFCMLCYNEYYDKLDQKGIAKTLKKFIQDKRKRKLDWVRRYKEKVDTYATLTEVEKELLISSILEWSKNDAAYLYDTECFEQKRASAQVKAFKIEVCVTLGDTLLNVAQPNVITQEDTSNLEIYQPTEILTENLEPIPIKEQLPSSNEVIAGKPTLFSPSYMFRPDVLTSHPIFGLKKTKLELTYKDSDTAYNDYVYAKDCVVTTIIENIESKMKQCSCITLAEGLYTLDQTDAAIIDFVVDQIGLANFIESDGCVDINVGELVQAVYKGESGRYYTEVIRRIEQLHCYKIQGVVTNTDGTSSKFSFSFFSDYVYHKKNRKTSKVSLVFGSTLKQAYIKASTIHAATLELSEEQKQKLAYSKSRAFMYVLSKERAQLGIKHIKHGGDPKQGYTNTYSLSYFKTMVRLTDTTRYKNMNIIEQALNELVEAHCIIEKIEKRKADFVISFLPLSPTEIAHMKITNNAQITNDTPSMLDIFEATGQ